MGIKSYDVGRASWLNNFNNNSHFNANDRNVNNHNALRGIAHHNAETLLLKPRDLWKELCRTPNLELAYKKARKHKTLRPCVLEITFEQEIPTIYGWGGCQVPINPRRSRDILSEGQELPHYS